MLDTPGVSFSIANVVIPKSGPKTVPCRLDFTGVTEHLVDLSQLVETYRIEYIQTLYVDNKDNNNELDILTDLTGQRITIPANSQGYFALLQPNPPKITFQTVAGAFSVNLQFMNVPVQPAVWGGVAAPFTGALTDAQLRASPVDVNTGLVQSLTNAQLRATPVPVSAADLETANDAADVVSNVAFPSCAALVCSVDTVAAVTFDSAAVIAAYPLQKGYNPIKATKVVFAAGTIVALYN